jgi:hypothetical protein
MSYSDRKVPILLIEDDDRHAEQVKSRLGETYDVVRLTTMDRVELYNYKALRQDSQIVIVDLVLGTQNSPHEGLDAVRNDLWQLDRTTFFVIFSQYLEENTLPPLNKFEPHWAFVRKETADIDLNEQCLENLFNVAEHCRECSSPVMATPQYQLQEWLRQLEDYKSPFDPIDSGVVRKNIGRSVDILDDLARAAAQYTKAGQQSRQIAIGIFGSCGRLEMRDDSDVECSVYYSGVTNNIVASTFWNRITSSTMSHSKKDSDFRLTIASGVARPSATPAAIIPGHADPPA